jgi:membrane protein YqaA with SNARE-associated domain
VLFSLSNSIFLKYTNQGLILSEILLSGPFWLEIMGIAIAGGLGAALGEITSFLLGRGAKIIVEKSDKESKTLHNIEGFGKLIIEHPNRMYLYVFIAAALPIPDDPLWIALGMSEKKFNIPKLILAGWAGKTITTTIYVLLPILIILGLAASGIEVNDESTVITEAIMLLVTLTIMFFILAFDWNKFLEDQRKKLKQIMNYRKN